MNNKTCSDCKSFPGMGYYCPIIGRFCDPTNESPCEFFEKPKGRIATNGDKIRQMSNEELAEFLIDAADDIVNNNRSKDDVLAWLNAPAESEGKDEVR